VAVLVDWGARVPALADGEPTPDPAVERADPTASAPVTKASTIAVPHTPAISFQAGSRTPARSAALCVAESWGGWTVPPGDGPRGLTGSEAEGRTTADGATTTFLATPVTADAGGRRTTDCTDVGVTADAPGEVFGAYPAKEPAGIPAGAPVAVT